MEKVNQANAEIGMYCYLSEEITKENPRLLNKKVKIVRIGPCNYNGYYINAGQCVVSNKEDNEFAQLNIGYENEYGLLINKQKDGKKSIKISNRDYKIGQTIGRGYDSISIRAGRVRCTECNFSNKTGLK